MSFVSIYAMESFVNVVSDGQVTGPDGEVIEKHFKKFKNIGEFQFMAVAGNKGVSDLALQSVPYKKSGYPIEPLSEKLHELALTVPGEDASILVAIGGINLDNEMIVISFSNKSFDKQIFIPKGDEIAYTFLGGKNDYDDIEREFISILKKTGYNTPNKSVRAQKQFNSYVSQVDKTVNKINFDLTIRKPV